MCRKLVVTNEIFLGARAICYEAYSLPKGEVVELTEKQITITVNIGIVQSQQVFMASYS